MSHPVPWMEHELKCSLCNKIAVDGMDIETGNNAEETISINLCEDHLDEQEKTGYAFEEKYSRKFMDLVREKYISMADGLERM